MWQQGKHPKEELISAMADGKLGVGETRRIAEHLHDCAECRAVMADFERTKKLLRTMEQPAQPDQKFWDDTFRKMRTMEPDAPTIDVHRVRRQWQGAIAAVACIFVAILGPVSYHVTHVPTAQTTPSAANVDSIDDADVTTFVRAHTEAAANQPLSDPDRQQMIAAEAEGMPSDDQVPEAVSNADVSP